MVRNLKFAAAILSGSMVFSAASTRAEGLYTADPVHSTVVFRVKHMNTSFAYGRFDEIAGQFSFDDQDPAQSKLVFQVKTASVDTANAKRDQHLKGPDFFNAVQYPTIDFKSTSVSKSAPEVYEVNGDLTLHGVTRPVILKVTKTGAGKDFKGTAIAGFETRFSIKRSDYKMDKMVGPVADDVQVLVSVEGAAK